MIPHIKHTIGHVLSPYVKSERAKREQTRGTYLSKLHYLPLSDTEGLNC